jgi:hypothetical protein
MPEYRADFLTHGNLVFGSADFEAEHDEAAKAHAEKHLRTGIGRGHEIWQGSRLVHREIYE